MYKRNQKKWYKHLDFIIIDWICVIISFFVAYIIRFNEFLDSFENFVMMLRIYDEYIRFIIYITLLHLVLVVCIEPYSHILYRNTANEFKKVFTYNVSLLLGMLLIFFMERSSILYSRIFIFTFILVNIVIMYFVRQIYKSQLKKRINKTQNQNCMLLVASQEQLDDIIDEFNRMKVSTVRIVGIALTDDCKKDKLPDEYKGIPVIGHTGSVYEYARTNVVDEALLCMDGKEAREMSETLLSMGITTHINLQNMIHIPDARMNTINNIPVITSSVHFVTSKQLVIKRMIDILFGLIGSLITVVATIFVAPMIWIADPGPIFFRQERVGKNGRTFKIWKFRTMYKDAEARKAELMSRNEMSGLMFKMEDDPRIIGYGKKISVGAILRKLSIDELPQFFNILEGSMSVVGTRPPTVKEYEQYELHHKGRLAIKPGLTGMWQVSGRNRITDFEEVVRLDKYYINNFCLRLDLEIILKTVKVVLFRDGSM